MKPHRIKTISEYHQVMGLPKPEHPLISVIDLSTINVPIAEESYNMVFDFYSVSLKRDFNAKIKYGQQEYDFDEGIMFFISPGQVFGISAEVAKVIKRSGWLLLFHPDFLWNSALAKTIRQYEFFDYSVHEALFVSEKEELTIIDMMKSIQQEYVSRIDKFSQSIIIAQMELLLKHAERFYNRQFITRQIVNHQLLGRLDEVLTDYFNQDDIMTRGLPSVTYIAEKLNISTSYLSGLLKVLTGQSAQQHIHEKLIAKAKEKLSTTGLTVSEIAYQLGFEHPQSFSKLFKTKTSLSPLEFRASFN
ncbi:helix-turn-helix transcriptional regulator [Mucilaginibacter sp. dw_454]|uniref:helix-turn-helix domain-containing protein n=1 Tax=Mucilaginibacter sp. dw_454 TaxID=2720079 RepID=UPI001BD57CDE|nr:helix-turn-helix transcriptional regulator [Mucilaginibacter sp. dw_454]